MLSLRRVVLLSLLLIVSFAPAYSADDIRDCPDCPVLVTIGGGEYTRALFADAPPQQVAVDSFALGKFEVTVAEFAAFIDATGHEVGPGCEVLTNIGGRMAADASWRRPGFATPPDGPAICVSWLDASAYAEWLSVVTGHSYRLPSEAEWDYAARAGAENNLRYYLRAGLNDFGANCQDCGGMDVMGREDLLSTLPVGRYDANPFGLHDMFGNAAEWVADCYNPDYGAAPRDGTAWVDGDCSRRIVRGGTWYNRWAELAGYRANPSVDTRTNGIGFRVARSLDD